MSSHEDRTAGDLGGSVPGREMKALEFAAESAEFWGKLAAEGKCTVPEQFISPATGRGYWFVKGDREVLLQLQDTDEVKALSVKGKALLQGYTWEFVLSEEEVDTFFANYATAVRP